MTTHYSIDPHVSDRIENTFKHHPPFGDQLSRYKLIRDQAKAFAYLIVANTPKSDEQLRALEHLDEVVTCANSAIARHEKPQPIDVGVFKGVYGGHDPNELPDLSEEAGGDPVKLEVPCGGKIPSQERLGNVIPA